MALTKEHLVNSISNHLGVPKARSAEVVESLLEIIKDTLESGENTLITGYGKILCDGEKGQKRKESPDRRGINAGCQEGGLF